MAFSQPLPDRHPFVGVAVDTAGKPIAGAVMSIRRQDAFGSFAFWGATTSTSAKGEFRFSQAEDGRYYLGGEADGFIPFNATPVEWKSNSKNFKVVFQKLVDMTLTLSKPDGSALANQQVWTRMWGDGSAGQQTRSGTTNGSGQVTFLGFPPAIYSVFLTSSAGFASLDSFNLKSAATQNLRLKPGGTLQLHFAAGAENRALGGVAVSLQFEDPEAAGKVVGVLGDPNVNMALLAAMGNQIAAVSRDGDGLVELENVPAGRFRLHFSGSTLLPMPPQVVTVDSDRAVELNLTPALKPTAKGTLTLQLKEANGQNAVGEFSIRTLPITANGMIQTGQISDEGPGGESGRHAVADKEGNLTIYPLLPGRYRFFISHSTGHSEDDGSLEATSIDVNVSEAGSTASLVLKAPS